MTAGRTHLDEDSGARRSTSKTAVLVKLRRLALVSLLTLPGTDGTTVLQGPTIHLAGFGILVIIGLFRKGARVCRSYGIEHEAKVSDPNTLLVDLLTNHFMVLNGKEEKKLVKTFATVFHYIDPVTFHEVFHSVILHLYEMMFEHMALLHVPQFSSPVR